MSGYTVTTATLTAPNWWPAKYPDSVLTFPLDIAPILAGLTGELLSASLAVAPSGEGEMQPSDLLIEDGTLFVTMSDGQPRQIYEAVIELTMSSGEVCQFVVKQGVRWVLPTDQPQIPPDPGPGTPVTWSPSSTGPSLNFSIASNSMYSLLIPGF